LLCRFLYEFPGELRLGEWSQLSSDMEKQWSHPLHQDHNSGRIMWTTEGSKVGARGARNICMIHVRGLHFAWHMRQIHVVARTNGERTRWTTPYICINMDSWFYSMIHKSSHKRLLFNLIVLWYIHPVQ
jgi:hypothetical protein